MGAVEQSHPVVVVVPLPSSPEVLSPQHSTVPPESSAQADSPPAAMAITELDEPPLDEALPLDELDEPPVQEPDTQIVLVPHVEVDMMYRQP